MSNRGSYLGYDVELVGHLLSAMQRAEDELILLASAASSVATASRRLTSVSALLRDEWIPFLRRLIGCTAMTGFTPAAIADGDLVNSWLASLVHDRGWRTSTDPLAPIVEPLSAAQATQLAHWLSDDRDRDDLDDGELAHLRNQLAELRASPALAAAFAAALTPAGVAALTARLGGRRTDLVIEQFGGGLSTDHQALLTTIDAATADFGSILARGGRGASDDVLAALSAIDPYAASLLIARLGLDAPSLATVATDLIVREQELVSTAGYLCGARAADVLFGVVLATEDGPSRFVVTMSAVRPDLLFATPADPTLTNQVLLAGTTPDVLSVTERALVIPAVLAAAMTVTSHPVEPYRDHNPAIDDVLGTMLEPYLVDLFAEPDNPLAIGDRFRDDAWTFILDSPLLLQHFVDTRDTASGLLTKPLGHDLDADRATLTRFAELLGLLDSLYEQGHVDEAARQRAQWDIAWSVLGVVPSALPLPGAAKAGNKLTLVGIKFLCERAGWAPAKVEAVRLDIVADADTRNAVIASIVCGTTFRSFIDQGRIPADTPPPPAPALDDGGESGSAGLAYIDALGDWADDVDLDAETTAWLLLASTSVLSPHEAATNGAPRRRKE